MTNTALPLLFQDLQRKFQLSYVLTYRLNQDALEHFFGVIRAKGGLHDHPDALEFKYRMRDYIIGKNMGDLPVNANVVEDSTPDMQGLSEELLTSSLQKIKESNIALPTQDIFHSSGFSELKYDSLEHLAGFICKTLNVEPCLHFDTPSTSYTWTDHLSEGGLIKASDAFMIQISKLEKIFSDFNGDYINLDKAYISKLIEQSTNVNCSYKVKELFFRSRMFFKIKKLNSNLHNKNKTLKRKMQKTVT